MNSKPRVFITQEMSNFDYAPAERFGEIVFVTHREMSNHAQSVANTQVIDDVNRRMMNDFDPRVDFVVFSGSPAVAAAVFLLIGARHPLKKIKLLKWSNRDLSYKLIEIEVTP